MTFLESTLLLFGKLYLHFIIKMYIPQFIKVNSNSFLLNLYFYFFFLEGENEFFLVKDRKEKRKLYKQLSLNMCFSKLRFQEKETIQATSPKR